MNWEKAKEYVMQGHKVRRTGFAEHVRYVCWSMETGFTYLCRDGVFAFSPKVSDKITCDWYVIEEKGE